MPKPPMPPETAELFRRPNPAVIAVLMPDGQPMSVATWYLVEDDGRVLVNMDAERARVAWMRQDPRVALTAVKDGEWYTHVSAAGSPSGPTTRTSPTSTGWRRTTPASPTRTARTAG